MGDTARAILSELTGLAYHRGSFRIEPVDADTIRLVMTERAVHEYDGSGTVVELRPGDSITLQVIGVAIN